MNDLNSTHANTPPEMDGMFRLGITLTFYLSTAGALLHLFWHFTFPTFPEMNGLTPAQWDLVKLLNLSIVLMMLFFAAVSGRILFVEPFSPSHTRFFTDLLAAFWLGRVILEFLFPVRIPVMYTSYTSVIVKVLGIAVVVILVIPEVRLLRRKRARESH